MHYGKGCYGNPGGVTVPGCKFTAFAVCDRQTGLLGLTDSFFSLTKDVTPNFKDLLFRISL